MDPVTKTALTWVGIGGAVALLYYLGKKEVVAAASAVNPLNNNNIIAQAANALVSLPSTAAGQPATTVGTGLYDELHEFIKLPDGSITEILTGTAWLHPGAVVVDAAGNPI